MKEKSTTTKWHVEHKDQAFKAVNSRRISKKHDGTQCKQRQHKKIRRSDRAHASARQRI